MDNFNLTIQNAIVSIVDHQDAKIKSVPALQHVILKCSENIDLYLKVSFGSHGPALLTPQVRHETLFFVTQFVMFTLGIQNVTSIFISDSAEIHFGDWWK